MGKQFKLRDWSRRFSVQLSLFFLGAGLTVILLLSGAVYWFASNLLMSETISKTHDLLEMSGANIGTYIARVKGESNVFAGSPSLRQYLSDDEESLRTGLLSQIDTLLQNDSSIKSIVVVSKDGRILSNEKNLDMSVSSDMMKEDWYIESIHNTMPVLTGARMQSFSSDKDNWVISVSTEITGDSGDNLGVLLMDMEYSVIEDHLRSLDLGREGYVFLLNDKGEPVYHKDTSYFSDPDKLAQLLEIQSAGDGYDKASNLLTCQTQIEKTGWTMVGVVSLDTLKMLERQLFEAVLLTGGLLFIAVLLIGILFTRRLSTPMADLERGMNEIEKLAEVRIRKNSFYEVELLAGNYNRMIHRIRILMDEISDKEKTLRHAELNALVSQINPHFLYNTLDTIVWMAEFNDSTRVIALTKSLAAFFRLSLSGGRELITVGDELEHVRQYLYIQKERYGDKLNYTIHAPEEVLDYTVPKIILQPIAENSIYHGIKPLDRPGQITITVQEEGEKLIFTVSDNGAGCRPDAAVADTPSLPGKVGLKNVDERLKLYYGPGYGVTIHSAPGAGCRVELTVGKQLFSSPVSSSNSSSHRQPKQQ
ncbi:MULTISPECIES: sensor histidine kinase [Hungatella]|uniref:Histidine kinase n=1 Tax=Hungatella hathewayi TaxID=154046 RepID=A0AA37JID4_9FIRM|nr:MULTISPECIES: sensor histidine kinase [Hungatella]MBT9796460.1 HAMP domain-containing protein [Hungatella hathewayi]MCI6455289.1 sensor histidine kinase [Hungatella sp.]GKG99315.1 histidine kinase [Hungatella hathewayi]GKH06139.1 histidine kinase [Hungatella hathewayi]